MKLKSMKLKSILTIVGVIGVGIWYLCQPKEHVIKMNSAEVVQVVSDSLKTFDADKYRIESLSWDEDGEMTNKLGYIYVNLVDKDDNRFRKIFYMNGTSYKEMEAIKNPMSGSSSLTPKPIPTIGMEEIKADEIVGHIASAVSQIPDEYEFQSVATYRMDKDNNTGDMERKFTLLVTKKGEAKEQKGRFVTTNYYELKFEVLPDGSVILKENE